jgi:hypothetical protein
MLLDVIKTADMDINSISAELLAFLKDQEPVYKDNEGLEEHLYNPDLIWEKVQEWSVPYVNENIRTEFAEIKEICETNECSYFRIIYK